MGSVLTLGNIRIELIVQHPVGVKKTVVGRKLLMWIEIVMRVF